MIPWQWRLAAAAIVAALCVAWWHFRPHPATVSIPVVASPSKAVKDAGRETVTMPVKVYKAESKNRLNLPKSPSEHLAASSTVKPDDHPHTLSTVIDDKTGEVTTYDTRDPLPWVAVNDHGEAGIGYGYKFSPGHGFGPMARLTVRQNLLDVKAARLSLQGTLDQDGSAFAGVFVTARW